jgi:hypothetical protein
MNEIVSNEEKIETMIYEVRGMQVMLDADLAKLYGCKNGTKSINLAVRRNYKKFPDSVHFQLNNEEYYMICGFKLKPQIKNNMNRFFPYVFTEEGVAMLATVLHTDIAINMTIKIIHAFVSMRMYISNAMIEQKYINKLVIKNDERLNLVEISLNKLSDHKTVNSIFYAGQIFDSYIFLLDLLSKAKDEVIIIDNYAGKELFKIIKDVKVKVIIVSKNINNEMVKKYQSQYFNLEIKFNNSFHDRFIILDKKILYHSGASFKDIGEKCFAINLIEDNIILNKILEEVNK